MARQVIDTNPPVGTPAPTAFGMVNAMFAEIYGWAGTGALAKLIGGNSFQGSQTVSAGNLRVQVIAGQDQFFVRELGSDGRVVVDAVNADNTAFRPLTFRGSALNFATPAAFVSTLEGPSLTATGAGATLGFVDRTDFTRVWNWYSSGAISRLWYTGIGDRLSVNASNGQVSAVSFNPTSSADVKDYLEGYAGDACEELDRLVVVTYRYRPEFGGPEGTVAGLLAENVQSVWPNAVGGDYDEERPEPVLAEDGTPMFDAEGEPVTVMRTHHVPMNIDMMQTLARCVRAHQQKSHRIRSLEATVADLQDAIAELQGRAA